MSTGIIGGNIRAMHAVQAALTPVSVAANTTAEQTFTLPFSASLQQIPMVSKPTAQAGLGISTSRISAPGVLAITYINTTGSPIVPTAENYNIILMSAEGSSIPFTIGF